MSDSAQQRPAHATGATVVVGVGNPLLADDTVGLHVVDEARLCLAERYPGATFACIYSGGFDFLDVMTGFDRAVIVDSMAGTGEPDGTCREFDLTHGNPDMSGQPRLADSHGLQLQSVLALGRTCGLRVPAEVCVIAIAASGFESFSVRPTEAVAAAIPAAVAMIERRLAAWREPSAVTVSESEHVLRE